MLSAIVKKIIRYWADKEIINEDDSDIYEYGLELILSSVFNIVVVIVTSVLTNRLIESIVLLLVLIPLQSCGGGYHAKTHLRCFLIMYIGWWPAMWLIPQVTLLSAIVISGMSLVTIFLLAPISHENVPISQKQRLKMKVLVRCFSVVAAFIGIASIWNKEINDNIGKAIIIGIGLVALSMFAARLKKPFMLFFTTIHAKII